VNIENALWKSLIQNTALFICNSVHFWDDDQNCDILLHCCFYVFLFLHMVLYVEFYEFCLCLCFVILSYCNTGQLCPASFEPEWIFALWWNVVLIFYLENRDRKWCFKQHNSPEVSEKCYIYNSEMFKFNVTPYLWMFVGVCLVLSDSELRSVTLYSYIE
jgi:hypothetical protein